MGIQRMTQYDLIFTFVLPTEPMIDINNYDDVDLSQTHLLATLVVISTDCTVVRDSSAVRRLFRICCCRLTAARCK